MCWRRPPDDSIKSTSLQAIAVKPTTVPSEIQSTSRMTASSTISASQMNGPQIDLASTQMTAPQMTAAKGRSTAGLANPD